MIKRNKLPGVYCIRCKKTGRRYIGSSCDLPRRLENHFSALRRGVHVNRFLQRAWDKYSASEFEFFTLRCFLKISPKRLLEVEQYYIDRFDATNFRKGFNASKVAGRPWISTERNRAAQLKVAGAHSARAKKQWQDPLVKEKMLAAMVTASRKRRGEKNPKQGAAMRILWENPEFREKIIRRQKEGRAATEGYVENLSKKVKAAWERPGFREDMSKKFSSAITEWWRGRREI